MKMGYYAKARTSFIGQPKCSKAHSSKQIYWPHKLFGTLYTKKHKVILKVNALFEDVFSVYISFYSIWFTREQTTSTHSPFPKITELSLHQHLLLVMQISFIISLISIQTLLNTVQVWKYLTKCQRKYFNAHHQSLPQNHPRHLLYRPHLLRHPFSSVC